MVEAKVEEIAGYISGNVKRKQVFDVLDKNASGTFDSLRKMTRTPNIIMEKVLENMIANGVIEKQGDLYVLTENGKKASNLLPKQSNKANINMYDSHIQRDI